MMTDSPGVAVSDIPDLLAAAERTLTNDPRESLRFATEARELALSTNDALLIARSEIARGYAYTMRSETDEALASYDAARKLLEAIDAPHAMLKLLYGEATILQDLGRHHDALDALAIGYDLADRLDDALMQASCLRKIGYSYGWFGDYSRCTEYMFRALEIWERVAPAEAGPAVFGLATIFERTGLLEKALEYYHRALELARAAGNRNGEAVTLGGIGGVHHKSGKYDRALEYYHQALAIDREIHHPASEITHLIVIGRIHTSAKRYDHAMESLREALSVARAIGVKVRQLEVLRPMTMIHIEEGRYQEAIDLIEPTLDDVTAAYGEFASVQVHQILALAYEGLGRHDKVVQHLKAQIAINEGSRRRDLSKALLLIEERLGLKAAVEERDLLRQQHAMLEHEMKYKERDLSAMSLKLRQREEAIAILKRQLRIALGEETRGDDPTASEQIEDHDTSLAEELWTDFGQQIDELHRDFIHLLLDRAPKLTPTELKICSLLKLNLGTKEIARLMGLAAKSVEVYRTRIRKKLALPGSANLRSFLHSL